MMYNEVTKQLSDLETLDSLKNELQQRKMSEYPERRLF